MRTAPAAGFGPSALATPANAITLARVLVTPVFIVVILVKGPSYAALAVGSLLAASDIADGWLARRHGTTRSGAFLDPLADKILIIGALAALVAKRELWWLPASLVVARELVISVYRTRLGQRGVSVPATGLAKLKTFAQDTAVGFAVLPPLAPRHLIAATTVLWVAVALSWWTGVQYLVAGERLAARPVTDP
ncbi:MAG TPA: CDP-alcohol phosphatidyltransferase family protein [Acidimicrobiales bacterium]|nr:CDP-alcohol phosphatidyltransferase family protein [Acidimicrobiales bacterium]